MMHNFILAVTLPPSTFDRSIARLNKDLDRIHQWSMANRLFINSSKSQAMIINPSLLPIDVLLLNRLGADVIFCYKKLKNLGLLINQALTWVNKICRNVSYTLRRLWPMADFPPVERRRKLVTSPISHSFYIATKFFCKSSMRPRERLKLEFNSCARYIYSISRGISRFQHISPFPNKILEVPLDTYYSFRVCCAMFRLIKIGCPGYLFDMLQFRQSSRLFNLITPVDRTASRALSFFALGAPQLHAILWNSLPSSVRREVSVN
jgi:hypothetical protein